ncbi:hypothetical protein Bca4012_064405 [Brassica carinata]|uniref:Uncharacterized protein n=1 Tax=Brassica carinata TaxID=52824 RepID=A0A8X7VK59_BRACI|nr:hypothetical protein Bca52824_029474 [Brassica carinata]KAG2312709.1 hypothetical protein Bca52824_024266 [Brassica carinata]
MLIRLDISTLQAIIKVQKHTCAGNKTWNIGLFQIKLLKLRRQPLLKILSLKMLLGSGREMLIGDLTMMNQKLHGKT